MNDLDRLHRTDKHYLGAGDGTIFAPPHPLWLHRPGFWDGGHVFLYGLAPLFTITLTDDRGGERLLHPVRRDWTPATLVTIYRAGDLEVEERRSVLPRGRFASELRVTNEGTAPDACRLVAWTAQAAGMASRHHGGTDGLAFQARVTDAQRRSDGLVLNCALTLADADGWAIHEAEHRDDPQPLWHVTPFHGEPDHLPDAAFLAEDRERTEHTVVFMALQKAMRLNPGASDWARATFHMMPADPVLRWRDQRTPEAAEPAVGPGVFPAADSAHRAWSEFLAAAPAIECTDPWLDRYLPYRWYGLRLSFIEPAGNYGHPTCAEGIEYFHCPIAYSAWCHVRELRWLHDPARARGALMTFLDRQREDGSLPGRVYLDHERRADAYIADWGGALSALEAIHPDRGFLEQAYPRLFRYADWLDADRDPDGTGLFDIRDPYETGQEYMSRYTVVDPEADRQHFEFRIRLKGVDLTVYAYRLRRALARAAARLGRPEEVAIHDAAADRIAEAVRRHMWDGEAGMFSDVDPATMRRTGVAAAVCFYPYMTDIAGPEHLDGLEANLLDPDRFWLPYPVPSTAADDPSFDPDGRWKGVRRNCPWNGRVWPMANAHLVEALGRAAELDERFREPAAELLERTVRMLFFDGDPERPNCFEHYSPLTGQPSTYRGIDDYQHSWMNDLVIRWAVGFRPRHDGAIVVDPLPLRIERLRIDGLPFRGHDVAVERNGTTIRLEVDGAVRGQAELGIPIEVEP